AFNLPTPILDGNVKRVLSRFHAVAGMATPTQNQRLWQLAEDYTPKKRIADYTQAMMDLGATVCTRTRPACGQCPVSQWCQAYLLDKVMEFPPRKVRKKIPIRKTKMLIFHNPITNEVLLEKRPPTGIWGGLWSFPECTEDDDVRQYPINTVDLPPFKHVFTHFQLQVTPVYIDHNIWGKTISSGMVADKWQKIWYKLGDNET